MAAYRVEADLLQLEDFPPLRRTIADIQASGSEFIGFVVNGQIQGVVELEHEGGMCINIASLVVAPAVFRQGIGAALIAHVLDAYPANLLTVSTALKNVPAVRLYEKFGFQDQAYWTTPDGVAMVTFRWH